MPNVLILPCSADYSEEAWMEIREKTVSILQTYFLEDIIPTDAISDCDEEEIETYYKVDQIDKQVKDSQQLTSMKRDIKQPDKKPKKSHARKKIFDYS